MKNPESIRTAAELSFENVQASWTVTGIHLSVVATVPGMADPEFQEIAKRAKRGCLVSRLVAVPVTLEARLHAVLAPGLADLRDAAWTRICPANRKV